MELRLSEGLFLLLVSSSFSSSLSSATITSQTRTSYTTHSSKDWCSQPDDGCPLANMSERQRERERVDILLKEWMIG